MNPDTLIIASARSVLSLAPAIGCLDDLSIELEDIERGSKRGHFTPDEDERIKAAFSQYLTARAALHETIRDLQPVAHGEDDETESRLRAFVVVYTAACLLVRAARFIVDEFATNKVIQRKLNEGDVARGLPRKQYTLIYQSLTNPINAWRILEARNFADDHRAAIESLRSDPLFKQVLIHLDVAEGSVRLEKKRYFKARLRYRWHAWRRRRASAAQQAMFALMEYGGRIVAEIHSPWHTKRVTESVRNQFSELLQPGDIIVARHDEALSNMFLPGYWPHAALHIGPASKREELGIKIDAERMMRWADPVRVLEAKKDGVLFRDLDETLSVDAIAVLRPKLETREIGLALSNAVQHEGKLYDFELDFFRSDRLVCTEVIYRAYHGVGSIQFSLTERVGRPTLSADDLINMALKGDGFEPIAVFGVDDTGRVTQTTDDIRTVLESSCE